MKCLFLLLMLSSTALIAQSNSSTDEKLGTFGPISLSYTKGVNKGRDYRYLYLYFQNKEYETIIDGGGFMFTTIKACDEFTKALSEAIEQSPTNVTASWDLPRDAKIQIYDFTRNIYLYDDRKWTTITIKKARLLIEKLEEAKSKLSEVVE